MSIFLKNTIDDDGFVVPKAIATQFHTTIKDIALLAGLPIDTLNKKVRAHSHPAQKRLHEIVQIINRVTPWCGNVFQAYAWYRLEPLPSFGDLTAEELVKQGKAVAVMDYLARTNEGGYA